MNEQNQNRPPVPLGVWIFWGLVGLGLLIALFRWATGGTSPTYIAPIAACVSAIAASFSVYMATKTLDQNRKDRQNEIESKHPRFTITNDSTVQWITELGGDHSIGPFYRLSIFLQNINESSAKHVKVKGYIFHNGTELLNFIRQPTDYTERNGRFLVSELAEGIKESDEPYFVKLYLVYRDVRTGNWHNQTLWRKFYLQGEENESLELMMPDKSELKALTTKDSKPLELNPPSDE